MVVAEIVERDRDGELIARPADWSGPGEAPRILVRRATLQARGRPRPGPRRARADARRVRPRRRPEASPPTAGASSRFSSKARGRVLGVYRELENGAGRALPIEKRGAAREIFIPQGLERRRGRRRSRGAGNAARGALRPALGARRRTARLGRRPSARSASSRSPPTTSRTSSRPPRSPTPKRRGPRPWPIAKTGAICRW